MERVGRVLDVVTGMRILVIDDETTVLDGLHALLGSHGIDAEAAADCETAEALISSQFFPVILADVRLRTEAEGFRLLEAVRRLSPRSRVASMTGHVDASTEARLRESGARLVLRKPFDEDLLIGALREMLAEVERAEAEKGGDVDELYSTTLNAMQAIARGRYRFPTEDAEELVQEAWLLFLEKRESIRTPKAWLTGTIANLCRQEIARRTRDRARAEEMPEIPITPADDAILSVRQALGSLDERSRVLCELLGMERHSYEEVSAAAGIPVGSVGPLYIRAKEKLRRALSN